MKLRLLNGSHSSIAYLGQLAGWQTVADAIAEPALAAYIDALMQEIATTLHLPASVDLAAYRRALLARFANPALRHLTAQIAMDGSQKLPQRLFAPALDAARSRDMMCHASRSAPPPGCGSCKERSDDGSALMVDDPRADAADQQRMRGNTPRALCEAIFAMQDVVPPGLAGSTNSATKFLRARSACDKASRTWRMTLIEIRNDRGNVNVMLKHVLAGRSRCGSVAAALPAMAQEPPAPGASPRIDAIRKAGALRVAVLANAPWLVENTTGGGEQWSGPAWVLGRRNTPSGSV